VVLAMTGAVGTPGGIASANLNILHALQELTSRRGLAFRILCLNESPSDRPDFIHDAVPFQAFNGSKLRYSTALVRSFSRETLYVFDHVRLAMPLAPFLAFGQAACVIIAHGSESWRRIRPSSRWLFRRARMCLTNSHFTLKKMRATFDDFNGADCLLGLSPQHPLNEQIPTSPGEQLRLRSVDGVERVIGEQMILLVSRMDASEGEKGHAQLLQIWDGVLQAFPGAQLVFAGPGNNRDRLFTHAESIGADSSVFIPGHQSAQALQKLYQACYAFVMPSRQEGFGLVYLEAMNHAKPCLGCYDNGSEDVIVHGETGLLIHDPDDPVELRGAITRLLASQTEASRLGLQGWMRLHECFTSRHAQARMMERVASLL